MQCKPHIKQSARKNSGQNLELKLSSKYFIMQYNKEQDYGLGFRQEYYILCSLCSTSGIHPKCSFLIQQSPRWRWCIQSIYGTKRKSNCSFYKTRIRLMAKQSLIWLLWKVSQQKVWHNFEADFPSQHKPPM